MMRPEKLLLISRLNRNRVVPNFLALLPFAVDTQKRAK